MAAGRLKETNKVNGNLQEKRGAQTCETLSQSIAELCKEHGKYLETFGKLGGEGIVEGKAPSEY